MSVHRQPHGRMAGGHNWPAPHGRLAGGRSRRAAAAVASLATAAALALGACSGNRKLPGDDQPTLASLGQRQIKLDADPGIVVSEQQTIAAYRKFLDVAPQAPQRADAMRRLGDLEMDSADRQAADSPGGASAEPDYRAAIARYRDFIKAYPKDPRNDRVLYQLARAQEQGGDLEGALKTLSALVQDHPGTVHAAEAQFRRGELLFAMRNYKAAEQAYATVLLAPQPAAAGAPQGLNPEQPAPNAEQPAQTARLANTAQAANLAIAAHPAQAQRSPLHERALYMQGWSLFKQGRLDEALHPFFGVLDIKLSGLSPLSRDEADLAALHELKRADRELVEDTFRVMSISLAGLQGAESVARYINDGAGSTSRAGYEFRVYQQLGELYIKQDRIKDAADTFALFVRRQPLHAQAPLLQARVIDVYQKNGFDTLALQAKKDHVQRYGSGSAGAEFRRANPSGWAGAQPLVKTHLAELARHHHALAQKSKASADMPEAVRWYRDLLASFPADAAAAANRFLLAELLFDNRRWADAAVEYDTVAYGGAPAQAAPGTRSADAANAGYAALLAYAAQEKDTADATERTALQRRAVASALRFGATFANDPRSGAVLTRSAEQLYALGDGEQANAVAQKALALQPPPAAGQRRTAWTVVAHHAFEQARFADAEAAYRQVLALSPEPAPGRADMAERLAAAIYRQGEAARSGGDARLAVGHFDRVAALGALPATSAVRASAQLDAAAALLGLKDWDAAARALQAFRREQPGHALQAEVAPKLALAYLELGRPSLAAAEFERVAATAADPALARAALLQAAELHDKAADKAPAKSPLLANAIRAHERYLQQHPQPVQTAVEARWRLAALARQDGQPAQALAWTQAVLQADAAAGGARTPRTRALAGQAALLLAEPVLDAYRKVPLIEPLQKQLALKKTRMEAALGAYAAAADIAGGDSAEVTTAATFHTAALYQDFGRALIGSARPKKLSKAELEQYTVLLEEQAFPFEEKAIDLHESNARRTAAGVYDAWVQSSFAELARLKPVRYGKAERGDAALPQDAAAIEALLEASPDQPALLNQLGIAQRRLGHFDKARQAYEAAIARAPAASAPQLNLAILFDLYLGDSAQAMAQYQRCLELAPADAPLLAKWLAELKTRKPTATVATVASRKEPPP